MKKCKITTEYRVAQIVGSMAISGVRVSDETRDNMTRVINGEVNGADLRRELVNKYRRQTPT